MLGVYEAIFMSRFESYARSENIEKMALHRHEKIFGWWLRSLIETLSIPAENF